MDEQAPQTATAESITPLDSPEVSHSLHDSVQPVKSDAELPKSDADLSAPASSISPSISQSHPILDQGLRAGSRIFLDICAGASRPLSSAFY